MGAFGRVAGQIANDWAAQRTANRQESEQLTNDAASRAEIAQRIRSQMLSDQLAQAQQAASERKDSLTNQVLEMQLRNGGYDFDKGQYEQNEHGGWEFVVRSPFGETRRFPAGEPLAAEERRIAADAAEQRQKTDLLAKQAAAQTKFNNDMALLTQRERAQDARAARLANTRSLTAQQKLQLIGPVNELQRIKSEIESIDKQLFVGKNPTVRTGLLGMFETKEMTDDQRAGLTEQRKQLVDQRDQVLTQIETIGALSSINAPTAAPNTAPPGATAPPSGKGPGPNVTRVQ